MDEPTAVLAPAGDRRAVPDAPVDDRRRPQRRVHQPQARRGARHRRPDHGHAPRAGHGRRPLAGGRDDGRPGPADGRPGRARDRRADAAATPGDVVLAVSGRRRRDNDRGLPALRGVSLEVRAGEIVGIAAVAGNGQSELAEVITGLRAVRAARPRRRRGRRQPVAAATGIEQRRRPRPGGPDRGRQRAEPVARRQPDHEALPRCARRARLGRRRRRGARRRRRRSRTRTGSRRPSIDTQARLAVRRQPPAADPRPRDRVRSRGCWSPSSRRAASTSARSRRSTGCSSSDARAGAAILLISEELDEILALADRVDVMYEGRIVGLVPADAGRRRDDRAADDRRPCARGCRRVGRRGRARMIAPARAAAVDAALAVARRDDPGAGRRARHQRRRSSRSSAATRSAPTATSSRRPSAASASSPTRSSRRRR